MKRGLLIAGGALGGLGAVMAITPPQFSSNESLALGGGAMAASTPTATATAPDHRLKRQSGLLKCVLKLNQQVHSLAV